MLEKLLTMIGHEDDEGIIIQTPPLQLPNECAETVVIERDFGIVERNESADGYVVLWNLTFINSSQVGERADVSVGHPGSKLLTVLFGRLVGAVRVDAMNVCEYRSGGHVGIEPPEEHPVEINR